tara:strand:- start:677 stop:1168 length:492 start_codon:yes stop_codon:yes gene_type:complete
MEKNIFIKYQELDSFNLLSELEIKIVKEAKLVANLAYAPYSNFHVGAALLLENNQIIKGNNQENTSFPCGICAERVALFSAKSNFPDLLIKKIAITAKTNSFELNGPVGPCGLCRQVLLEYEEQQKHDIEVILFDTKKIIKLARAKDLLPFYFQENKLKKNNL